ncbi:MAG TPA: hypothetical protein VIP11_10170 [Gemmatimonadaceae bacterium]
MPDTWLPYRIAYVVVAATYAAYALSIWLRAKRVKERLEGVKKADPSLRS